MIALSQFTIVVDPESARSARGDGGLAFHARKEGMKPLEDAKSRGEPGFSLRRPYLYLGDQPRPRRNV